MTERSPAVEVRGLVKDFDGFRAVDAIDFTVDPSICFGILGPNGAGKTTTIRMLHGYSPPTAGSIRVFGIDVVADRRAVAALTGVCQQDNNLDPDLSVRENLLVFARYFDIPREEAARRADRLLAFSALEGKRDARVSQLSGGMMRRLVLARALINEPQLVILDEPTTGLDPQSRHQLWERVRRLKGEGVTVLLTTHYMDEAERLCDRLLIMDQGRVLVEGAPNDLIRRHAGGEVIEVSEPDEALRLFVRERGIEGDDLGHRMILYGGGEGSEAFHEITKRFCTGTCMLRQATLEDVFLRLTGRELRE